jgi:hypothetical protein
LNIHFLCPFLKRISLSGFSTFFVRQRYSCRIHTREEIYNALSATMQSSMDRQFYSNDAPQISPSCRSLCSTSSRSPNYQDSQPLLLSETNIQQRYPSQRTQTSARCIHTPTTRTPPRTTIQTSTAMNVHIAIDSLPALTTCSSTAASNMRNLGTRGSTARTLSATVHLHGTGPTTGT